MKQFEHATADQVAAIAAADRLLVVGVSATGKTRLAQEVATIRDLPIVNLDKIFWMDNWVERPQPEVEKRIRAAVNEPRWIIEGYIEPLSRERVDRANVVIDLNFPGRTALRGGLDRWRTTRGRARGEMPVTNVERFGASFLWTLLRREERPEIDRALAGCTKPIVRLRSRRGVARLVHELTRSAS
jgi:adenylate kinase family enzyme